MNAINNVLKLELEAERRRNEALNNEIIKLNGLLKEEQAEREIWRGRAIAIRQQLDEVTRHRNSLMGTNT